jgi:hypothetical protein
MRRAIRSDSGQMQVDSSVSERLASSARVDVPRRLDGSRSGARQVSGRCCTGRDVPAHPASRVHVQLRTSEGTGYFAAGIGTDQRMMTFTACVSGFFRRADGHPHRTPGSNEPPPDHSDGALARPFGYRILKWGYECLLDYVERHRDNKCNCSRNCLRS